MCDRLAAQCDAHAERLAPFADRYGEERRRRARAAALASSSRAPRRAALGLLRDLQDLYLMATECDIAWTVVGQAAQGVRDGELLDVVQALRGGDRDPAKWLRSRMKEAAPQALVVA